MCQGTLLQHNHGRPSSNFYFGRRPECRDEESRRQRCAALFRTAIEKLNQDKYREIEGHLSAAIDNVLSAARYERLQWDGPRVKQVGAESPLVPW